MDAQFDFRALLIKLQDCLSDNDRRRLHFIVGDTIPRNLRDDPTLGGTLSLLESLFDRAKISEEDFGYLIQAFREIHCDEGVKRLQEYQLANQRGRNRSESIILQIAEDNNEEDKIVITKNVSTVISRNNSVPHELTSTEITSISFDKQNSNADKSPPPISSVKPERKIVNINLTFIKQTLKSRLTACQLILLLLNILGILIFVIIIVCLRKQQCSMAEMNSQNVLIIKEGMFFGDDLGGDAFDDATTNSLTLNDKLIGVQFTWSYDTLNSVTFVYSNGAKSTHGTGDALRPLVNSGEFDLVTGESFNGVAVYIGMRDIINPYKPNGTVIIVGLRFFTNKGRQSDLFGSSNGTEYDESFPDYTLAYVQGRSYAFIDALQFVWYKGFLQSKTSMIAQT